jgi:hypothetical protein
LCLRYCHFRCSALILAKGGPSFHNPRYRKTNENLSLTPPSLLSSTSTGGSSTVLPGARRLNINMEGPNEDFKGFEDGFSGFPKHLPEDCVEYCIYVIDSKLSPKEILLELEAVRKESLKLIDDLLTEYIWQRESFKLDLESGKGML